LAAETLTVARTGVERGWCQWDDAVDKQGRAVDRAGPGACRWSLTGAWRRWSAKQIGCAIAVAKLVASQIRRDSHLEADLPLTAAERVRCIVGIRSRPDHPYCQRHLPR